jgi:hypothetical protein
VVQVIFLSPYPGIAVDALLLATLYALGGSTGKFQLENFTEGRCHKMLMVNLVRLKEDFFFWLAYIVQNNGFF